MGLLNKENKTKICIWEGNIEVKHIFSAVRDKVYNLIYNTSPEELFNPWKKFTDIDEIRWDFNPDQLVKYIENTDIFYHVATKRHHGFTCSIRLIDGNVVDVLFSEKLLNIPVVMENIQKLLQDGLVV